MPGESRLVPVFNSLASGAMKIDLVSRHFGVEWQAHHVLNSCGDDELESIHPPDLAMLQCPCIRPCTFLGGE